MLYTHAVYNLINKEDKVIDIGGGMAPFRRANWVVDFCPYEERAFTNSFLSQIPESFSKETWVQQDICNKLPFKDKEFDFAVCTHLLEDIRDPISVIKEIQRIAHKGYIEVPSRFYEQLMGLQYKGMCGASHHRWITDLRNNNAGENELVFIFKNHKLHCTKNLQIKKPWGRLTYPYIGPKYEVLALVWNEAFAVREDIECAISGSEDFFEETVRLANKAGSHLFHKRQLSVVEYTNRDIPKGIHLLSTLSGNQDHRVMIYTKRRKQTADIMAYEAILKSRA